MTKGPCIPKYNNTPSFQPRVLFRMDYVDELLAEEKQEKKTESEKAAGKK